MLGSTPRRRVPHDGRLGRRWTSLCLARLCCRRAAAAAAFGACPGDVLSSSPPLGLAPATSCHHLSSHRLKQSMRCVSKQQMHNHRTYKDTL